MSRQCWARTEEGAMPTLVVVGVGNRGPTIHILDRMRWQGLGVAGTQVGPQPAWLESPGVILGLEVALSTSASGRSSLLLLRNSPGERADDIMGVR